MSAVTWTWSPIFMKVTVPVTWLPDFDSNLQVAFVTSCPCAINAQAHTIPSEMIIVFMAATYGCHAGLKTINRAVALRAAPMHSEDLVGDLEPARARPD